MTTSVQDSGKLFACKISMRYLISHSTAEIVGNYFRFRKTDGHHFGILFPVSISKKNIVSGMSFYICLPNFVVIGQLARSYDVISTFQDGGHRVGNVLPGSGLVTGSD